MQAGTVVAMSVGGWLCSITFLGGWPSVFYIFGGLGVIWGIPWFLLVHDLPEQHPRISFSELQYILEHRYYVKRDKVMDVLIYAELDVFSLKFPDVFFNCYTCYCYIMEHVFSL